MRASFTQSNRFPSARFRGLALWGLGFCLSFSSAVPAFAQVVQSPVANAVSGGDALRQQVASLRARLATLATEIQNLKKKSRTVSEDYRLRERLSEADVVGRRLTESEAQLRRLQGATPPASQWLQVNPSVPLVRPSDGPRELDAKADILLDQAERFAIEATRIEAQVQQSERRDVLRRRVRRVESDPFIALEASKRSLLLSSQSPGTRDATGTPESTDDGAGSVTGSPVSTQASTPSVSDMGGAAPVAPVSTPPAPETSGGRGATATTPVSSPSFSGSDALTGHAVLPPQFRTLLDPQTLAEVRRLEGVGTPASRAAALRTAVAALRARAAALQQQSKSLRHSK